MRSTSASPSATSSGTASEEAAGGAPAGRDPLLAAICHDLRAPLAAVTMGANFVLQTTPEDEASGRSRRVLQAILRSCKQMERLVRDFADLSQIEADAVELRHGFHDARQMLAMAVEAEREGIAARGLRVELEEDAGPLVLRCDRDRILRALGHVLENAVRHAPEGSALRLGARLVGSDIALAVTDHGAGLSEETLAHLYDRGWHGRRASRVGAGLGLAIARGFLRAHGGSVGVVTRPGETTFTLTLPRDTASVPDVSALLAATPSRAARPSRS